VPFLKALGIEEEVAGYSVWKPGATFSFDDEDTMSFLFGEVRAAETPYSYNVPRDRLDQSMRDAAVRAGARFVAKHGRVLRAKGERVELADESLAAAGLAAQPDFIVDAGGRARLLGRLLDLPIVEGQRRDMALHAHLEGVPLAFEGHVHTDLLEHGWSWRIPLPTCVSVGLVIDAAVLREFGDSAEEQFDAYLCHDRRLRGWGVTAKRLSPVVKYTNYQARHTRGVGANWALVGDAFGFVDPVFSSGMLVGLDAAQELARTLMAGGGEASLARYEAHVQHHLSNWQRVATYFYDGRLFTLLKLGDKKATEFPWRLVDPHFQKHLPRVFTGESTTRRYSMGLLDFMVRWALTGSDPAPLAVR
jgi:flavin-dependent dehydrogenase